MTAGSGLRPRDPPLLHLPAAKQILALGPTTLAALGELLSELDAVSRRDAERAWTKRKGPMARYRLDVATHVAALRRAIRWARVSGTASTCPRVHSDEHKPRSSRAAVRNPLLRLHAVSALLGLPHDRRAPLRRHAQLLAADCSQRAELCWKAKQRSAAVDWRTAAVYAGHLARALLHAPSAQCEIHWDAGPVPSAPHTLRPAG
jgi:hypothetical protein